MDKHIKICREIVDELIIESFPNLRGKRIYFFYFSGKNILKGHFGYCLFGG